MFVLTTSSALVFTSCKKDLEALPDPATTVSGAKSKILLPNTVNPLSLRNVEKAKATLAANSSYKKDNASSSLDNQPQFVYFKFNPASVPGTLVKILDDDTTVKLLSFPFANAALYNDSFALDEAKAEQLNDGNVYGVINMGNPILQTLSSLTETIQTQFLDTLTLVPEEDTALLFQSFREAGYSEQQINILGICLLKRPHGFVRYQDNELGGLVPVRRIGVWALVFGIPINSFTDDNGYYQLPWRFSLGTIMGTMAKNQRVNVKPFDTHGGWAITALIQALVVGPVDIIGWRSSCQMRNDINIDLTAHKQNRLWAQILNNYAFNEDYNNNEGINNPPLGMICYAHWGGTDLGNASTPLLGHLNYGTLTLEFILNTIMGEGVNIPNTYPNLFNAMTGIMPDMTVKVGANTEPQFYSSRIAQTLFHELGHASFYHQVGENYYVRMMVATLHGGKTGYGDPGYKDWGMVQVSESWAEFMGTEHARIRYGTAGWKRSSMFGNNNIQFTPFNQEREDWFVNRWIPCGLYYDLMDNVNLVTAEDIWDQVGGASIQEMYDVFNPYTDSICAYFQFFQGTYNTRFPYFITQQLFWQYENVACF